MHQRTARPTSLGTLPGIPGRAPDNRCSSPPPDTTIGEFSPDPGAFARRLRPLRAARPSSAARAPSPSPALRALALAAVAELGCPVLLWVDGVDALVLWSGGST